MRCFADPADDAVGGGSAKAECAVAASSGGESIYGVRYDLLADYALFADTNRVRFVRSSGARNWSKQKQNCPGGTESC
jgi:hypothetical protein